MPKQFYSLYERCNTMPKQSCTAVYERCKFLSMGYVSAMSQASVLISSKNVSL